MRSAYVGVGEGLEGALGGVPAAGHHIAHERQAGAEGLHLGGCLSISLSVSVSLAPFW